MVDRSFKIYQGEDNSPVTDMTDESTNSMAVNIRWEDAEFGTRAYRGESTNSNITVNDPNGVTGNEIGLPGGLTRVSLASRNVLEFVHGSNILWRGRMATKDYSRGEQRASRYREAAAYLEDINLDLRGIVVHGWSRPAETDVARLQGLIASYLWGNPRRTTKINGSNLLNAGSNVINLPAKTYDQTSPYEIIEEIAQAAGKTYHLLPRRRTTDTHTAELYYDGNDAVLEQCPYRITDREDEVRASPRAHFYPWWNVGPASTENGQEMLSGVWLFYGVESYVHVSDAVQANLYSHWEEVIFDGVIDTEAEALARANSVLAQRKYEERTYNVTIGPLDDFQIGGIRAGQHIYIKARAIPDADDAYVNRKISQLKVTTPMPGVYFAHLQLDRPLRAGAHGAGSPVGPKPPTQPTAGGSVRLYPSDQSSGSSSIDEADDAPNLVWSSAADADWDVLNVSTDYYYMFDTPQGTVSPGQVSWAAVNQSAPLNVGIIGEVHRLDGALLSIVQGGGTVHGQWRAKSRHGIGVNDGAQRNYSDWCVRVYRPGTGFVATLLDVGTAVGDTHFATNATPTNRTWSGSFTAYPAAVDGDYVVVDLGILHIAPTTGATGVTLYYNDEADIADLPEDEFETSDLNAWIEFRGTATGGTGTQPTVLPGDETVGEDNDHYSPIDHTHSHGLLADDGVHMHDADQIDGLEDFVDSTTTELALLGIDSDLMSSWWTSPKAVEVNYDGIRYLLTSGVTAAGVTQHQVTRLADLDVTEFTLGSHEQDDHNAAAIIAPEDKPRLLIWSRHNQDAVLRWRSGTTNDPTSSLNSAQTLTVTGDATTYAQAQHRIGTDEVYIWSRIQDGGDNRYWDIFYSDDYLATSPTQQRVFDFGASQQGYIGTVQTANDPDVVRVALTGHPTLSTIHDIYYCEVNLDTGAITKQDGTSLGNFKTGSSLPIVVTTELDMAVDIDTGTYNARLFDVGDGDVPELLYAQWTGDSDATYFLAWYDGSAWNTSEIVAAGESFGFTASVHYNGGAAFPHQTPGRQVILSREADAVWYLERWVRGDTWVSTELATSDSSALVRPFPVVDGTLIRQLWHDVTSYTDYEDWAASLVGAQDGESTSSGETGVSDHGLLNGLDDDDHAHYLTEERHDAHDHSTVDSHILLADGRATPFTFNDLLQMDDGSDFMWSD
jgi:hypothetical protein